jgi:L-amino acid N-acyltransferase YncA
MNLERVALRPSATHDLPAMAAIYAYHVQHGTGSFELEAPSLDELSRRRDDILAMGMPWLVAESGGQLLGYAYAGPFRLRPAYRFTLEDSIYVDQAARGRGLGRLLLAELIARCEAQGARQMLAVVGDAAANAPSIALHRSLGFADCGMLQAVGWKFDTWRDVKMMQRALGCGAQQAAPR